MDAINTGDLVLGICVALCGLLILILCLRCAASRRRTRREEQIYLEKHAIQLQRSDSKASLGLDIRNSARSSQQRSSRVSAKAQTVPPSNYLTTEHYVQDGARRERRVNSNASNLSAFGGSRASSRNLQSEAEESSTEVALRRQPSSGSGRRTPTQTWLRSSAVAGSNEGEHSPSMMPHNSVDENLPNMVHNSPFLFPARPDRGSRKRHSTDSWVSSKTELHQESRAGSKTPPQRMNSRHLEDSRTGSKSPPKRASSRNLEESRAGSKTPASASVEVVRQLSSRSLSLEARVTRFATHLETAEGRTLPGQTHGNAPDEKTPPFTRTYSSPDKTKPVHQLRRGKTWSDFQVEGGTLRWKNDDMSIV
mmetsp:Transcript_26277/g.61278  ORF Transcript_26277/g.61278 Transcript_26277/m.61278 type:complete len:365 (-) Transcript_26277:177-1271(-)|eukprot:CAMPEP_0171127274 /NCGR_PEP_ID=MMETSP0766_2-20121228/114964_1 /TAXON_ID=439317 /ORGANISM="Gambierdiscus australes, Strain CAWD 149" /LENGTH=364 /DNA_ID=CAMNT_0011590365 /DNA_START=152 /DNA_END=1246 /DNA_ORIENTATION=+